METDPKKRRLWPMIAAVALVPVLYVASYGPYSALTRHLHRTTHPAFGVVALVGTAVYYPLDSTTGSLRKPLERYIGLWTD